MIIDDNGVLRAATPEEEALAIAERVERELLEAKHEPTAEERLAALEDALAELMGVLLNG